MSHIIKSHIKKTVKSGIRLTRRVVVASPHLKKLANVTRDIFLPGYGVVNIYDHSRFTPTIAEYLDQLKLHDDFKYKPLISVVMPTYNTPLNYLKECIESVLIQSYPNWELCVADDASSDGEVVKLIKDYMKKDKRIKLVVRPTNGHISEATNSAIEIARGEFIGLLDHDDILWPNALFEVVKVINDDQKVDLVYSDEDKIDKTGKIHSYPFFKPDWSPEFLESCNYITHFSCIRTDLVRRIGGFRKGYEGAQDWDLFMRIVEVTNRIVHIPKLLYSWRVHEASTASDTNAKPYVFDAQKRLLNDHIDRMGLDGTIKPAPIVQHSIIEYHPTTALTTSIIVAGGTPRQLEKCVQSIRRTTLYKNVELIVVADHQKRIRRIVGDSLKLTTVTKTSNNMSAAYNRSAKQASGDFLIFIDGSMKISTQSWLEVMLGDLQRDGVGVVGGKTLTSIGDRFMRAGVGIGIYGSYASLLEGMPVGDVHYMRGLYGQSRRNVSAVDSGCTGVSSDDFKAIGGFSEDLEEAFVVDACLQLRDKGKRHIYNPAIEIIDQKDRTAGAIDVDRSEAVINIFKKKWKKYIDNDPYLNPAFTRTNAQLEVR